MKCDVVATFCDRSLVVRFCSATAPLTCSNTGRIAAIAAVMRCTASTEFAASRCSASIFCLISSVASWVCTAKALTSVATTAKPRPAEPARAASMVEFNASKVVCRAICEIRLTTLPIAAEDSRKRSTFWLASSAAALAWSARSLACRTWAPMPSAEWVNFSAAWENVVAVVCAALVRPVRASVRSRMACSVDAVDCAPLATELAARSSWRISPLSSSSSSSRISCAELSSAAGGGGDCGDLRCGSGNVRLNRRRPPAKQTQNHECFPSREMEFTAPCHPGREFVVKIILRRRRRSVAPLSYSVHPAFDFGSVAAYKAAPASRPIHAKRLTRPPWPDIPNSRTSCTARGGRTRRNPSCSASWRAKSPSPPSSARRIRR